MPQVRDNPGADTGPPSIANVTATCGATNGGSLLTFTVYKGGVDNGPVSIRLTNIGTGAVAWTGGFGGRTASRQFTVTGTPDGTYELTAVNDYDSDSVTLTVACGTVSGGAGGSGGGSCDLVMVGVVTHPAGEPNPNPPFLQTPGFGWVRFSFTTGTIGGRRFQLGGAQVRDVVFPSPPTPSSAVYYEELYNLPAGAYTYRISLVADDTCSVSGTFIIGSLAPGVGTNPPSSSPAPCRLQVKALDAALTQNGIPGKLDYQLIGTAGSGKISVSLIGGREGGVLERFSVKGGDGGYTLRSLALAPGDYQLQVSENTATPFACSATATFTLLQPAAALPGSPAYGAPATVGLTNKDGWLSIRLRQRLQLRYALDAAPEKPDEFSRPPEPPQGLSFIPAPKGQGFAQAGAVSGTCASRLGEVRGFDGSNPFVTGQFGVSSVEGDFVTYELDGIQYRTNKESGYTEYRIGYVNPAANGLLPVRGLIGNENIPYHERRATVSQIALNRYEQSVLLDFYAVARANNLDELPLATNR